MPRWDEIRDDLFEAIIQVHAPISKEQQAEIVAILQAKGHAIGWNAIRYVLESISLLTPEPGGRVPSVCRPIKCLGWYLGCELFFSCCLRLSFLCSFPTFPSTSLFFPSCPPHLHFTSLFHHTKSQDRRNNGRQTHSPDLGCGNARGHPVGPDRAHQADWERLECCGQFLAWQGLHLHRGCTSVRLQTRVCLPGGSIKGLRFLNSPRLLPFPFSSSHTLLPPSTPSPFLTALRTFSCQTRVTFSSGKARLAVIKNKMTKQPTTWDHDAHLALLQAVMAEAPPSPAQWERILERVTRKGYAYTASAAM